MINATTPIITPETALSADAAAARFAIDGRKPHRSAVCRWMTSGVLRGEHRIILASELYGSRRVTSDLAINQFKQALAAADQAARRRRHRHVVSEPTRRAELEAAEAELQAAGL